MSERSASMLSRALGREVTVEELKSPVLQKVETALLGHWRAELERTAAMMPGVEQARALEVRDADDAPTWEFALLIRGGEAGFVEQRLNCPPPIRVTIVEWQPIEVPE